MGLAPERHMSTASTFHWEVHPNQTKRVVGEHVEHGTIHETWLVFFLYILRQSYHTLCTTVKASCASPPPKIKPNQSQTKAELTYSISPTDVPIV